MARDDGTSPAPAGATPKAGGREGGDAAAAAAASGDGVVAPPSSLALAPTEGSEVVRREDDGQEDLGRRDPKRPRLTPAPSDGDGRERSYPSAPSVAPVDRSVSADSAASVTASLDAKLSVGGGGGGGDGSDGGGDGEGGVSEEGGGCTTAKKRRRSRKLVALRLEAIFHPKFENESQSNAYVRSSILERVSAGRGYLEATLKHSGSLLLWSGGGDRFYSKNAADNAFTAVGEVLLRQHFARAWYDGEEDSGGGSASGDPEAKYRECSDYVSRHRLTLSFEVVTSVLGHHGDVPKRDYLILTAVADVTAGTFYDTPALLELAQRFRLPHNDVWTYPTAEGVREVLEWYDGTWEMALADGTVGALTDIVERRGGSYVPSPYPHVDFQGNVLEGLVVRYVSFGSGSGSAAAGGEGGTMKKLAEEGGRLLREEVPSDRPTIFEILAERNQASGGDAPILPEVLTTDVREVRNRHDTFAKDDSKFSEALRSVLGRVVPRTAGGGSGGIGGESRRKLHRCKARDLELAPENGGQGNGVAGENNSSDGGRGEEDGKVDMPALVRSLLDDDKGRSKSASNGAATASAVADRETRRIARLIRTLERIRVPVEYKVYREDRGRGLAEGTEEAPPPPPNGGKRGGPPRYLCIVHVLTDYSFKKYRNAVARGVDKVDGEDGTSEEMDDVMPLYRGFSFRMVFEGEEDDDDRGGGEEEEGGQVDGDGDAAMEDAAVPLSSGGDGTEEEEEEPLMLKMKLLPYMVRTFCCRNGLRALLPSSSSSSVAADVSAYDRHCLNHLRNWGCSDGAVERWMPFLRGWGRYAARMTMVASAAAANAMTDDDDGGNDSSAVVQLPPPSGARYLEHLERYGELFYAGKEAAAAGVDDNDEGEDESGGGGPPFLGMVFVVSLTKDAASSFADRLAGAVGRGKTKRIDDVNSLTEEDASLATTSRGLVCSAVVEDGAGRLRKLNKKYGKQMFIVLVGCGEKDVAGSAEEGSKELKKRRGMLNAWRKCRCNFVSECSSVASIAADAGTDGSTAEVDELVGRLREETSKENGAGGGNGGGGSKDKDDGRPGALVFFPTGVPGCGKSALCEAVNADALRPFLGRDDDDNGGNAGADTTTKDEEKGEKERPVVVRVGDEVKGSKFWPLVRRERSEAPSSIYVADKNAPPALGSWDFVVEDVCAKTRAVAVPVLPDAGALRTARVEWEEGGGGAGDAGDRTTRTRRVEEFPLSLPYLAVCLCRVLSRPPGEHKGKLDAGTDNAAMVVVMFYCLYKNLTAEGVERALVRGSATQSAIRVPFFKDGQTNIELPGDLDLALRDAVRLQLTVGGKSKKSSSDADALNGVEERLRSLIAKYRTDLDSLTASLDESRSSFLRQLGRTGAALDRTPTELLLRNPKPEKGSEFIKIVSIDVDRQAVHDLLRAIAKSDEDASNFLELSERNGAEEVTGAIAKSGMVKDTHVTMVHHSSSSQIAMRSSFGTLVERGDTEVDLSVTAFLYGERAAALAVAVPRSTLGKPPHLPIPRPDNDFGHITVWFGNGGSAVGSNDLPRLVEEGRAKMVKLEEPVGLRGKFSFWMT